MSVDTLLSRLDKVKVHKTKSDSWQACCPAHNDKSPSLSIREISDGRVLVHCFGGCSVEEVLSAVGLTFADLYPEKCLGEFKSERRPFPAADVLRAVATESTITYLAAQSVAKGDSLSAEDTQRLLVAAGRIQAALIAGGLSNV